MAWWLALLPALLAPQQAFADAMRRETITLTTQTGATPISAEIALSGPEQEQGLMFRTSLGENDGMLFIYAKPMPVGMWMHNTYIALDIVFIDAGGRIARIEENAEPLSDRVISAGAIVLSVLELKAGTARRLGLQRGDRVTAPSLPVSAP